MYGDGHLIEFVSGICKTSMLFKTCKLANHLQSLVNFLNADYLAAKSTIFFMTFHLDWLINI